VGVLDHLKDMQAMSEADVTPTQLMLSSWTGALATSIIGECPMVRLCLPDF
jgi:hypothetical protein